MGIISTIKASHDHNRSATDTTDAYKKWGALIKQEETYEKMYNLTLKNYRNKLNVKNSSWNGAATGYLY